MSPIRPVPDSPSLHIHLVPSDKLTPDVRRKIDALLTAIDELSPLKRDCLSGRQGRGEAVTVSPVRPISDSLNLHVPKGTLSRWKAQLRKLFNLPPRSSLHAIMAHPQFRAAVENIVVHSERNDKNSLRAGKQLGVVVPNGEVISIESLLKSLYTREGVNASACYAAIESRCKLKLIVHDDGTPASIDELPSGASVTRFLRNFRRDNMYARRARSRKHDWETTQEPFVTRNPDEYRPGQLWFGDHTELDFLVINERGKIDRRWITAWIDMRTRLIMGYYLSWQPNSTTIAIAFHNGVTGKQILAYNGEQYVPVTIQCVPEEIEIDNGKDYRSKYTQRVFGKIDFADQARYSIDHITRLHYAQPYHGMSKAEMERWFGTIQTMLKYLPGYKGSQARKNQPDALKDEVKQGEIMTVDVFDKMIALAVNVYNNRIHRGLKNQSPLQCYLTSQSHNRIMDERVLDFLMMKVSDKIIRRAQFVLLGNEYYAEPLMESNGRKAEIYYDPMDLGFVSVYVDGKFAAVAVNKEMIGKDERGWMKVLHDRRQKEKQMQEKIKEAHGSISRIDAKMLLLEGQFSKAVPVSPALRVPDSQIVVLTGVEKEAIEQSKKVKAKKEIVELEETAKKLQNAWGFNMANVNKIK